MGGQRRYILSLAMALKVCKFGGTSLADAAQIDKVRTIVQSDPDRRYVVPSAPGKRHREDQKITDLLYLCHEHAKQGLGFDNVFGLIAERYRAIVGELGLKMDIGGLLEEVRQGIADAGTSGGGTHPQSGRAFATSGGSGGDYAASRGEYLNGRIIAAMLDCPFVDAAKLIFFDKRGRLDEARTYAAVAKSLAGVERAVIPGFYGTDIHGRVKTLSRGGSDVTGAIIARGVGATLYENWTDVSGLLMADPRVVDRPRTIDTITYAELRELAYMGATVLHDEAIFPVRHAGIPVNIRNTNRPDDAGTMIVAQAQPNHHAGSITGIAGKKNFTVIALEKALMNGELGFGLRVLAVLERHGINFEHLPSGIDTMSIVIDDGQLDGKLDDVLQGIRQDCEPDSLDVSPDMALIATVGRGMAHTPGMAARLFAALGSAHVNIRMIDQGSSELNIIVGVAAADFEKAMRAIYAAFV